jgi:hypothetical protein
VEDLELVACDDRVVFMVSAGGICRLMRSGMDLELGDTHRRGLWPVTRM